MQNKGAVTNGFTLLEIIIAVGIMSLVLVVLLTTHNKSLELMHISSKLTTATMLAKEVMEKAEIEGFPDETNDSGSFEEEGFEDMEWEKIISEGSVEKMRKVEVKVYWGKDRYVRLVSFVADK